MPEDFTKDGEIKAQADLGAAFARAHEGVRKEKKPERPKVALDLEPPAPMGMEQSKGPPVSPQLREEPTRDEVREKALKAMRMARDFRNAARDAWER